MHNLFNSLPIDKKIDFFIECQKLLIKYHSNSSFIIRENNLQQSIDSFAAHIKDYKGYCYIDENICVLFNYIIIDESKELNYNEILKANAYKSPAQNYNGISIDFVTFRNIVDSLVFISKYDSSQIRFVLFIREGKVKLHKKEDLLKKLPCFSKNSLGQSNT